MDYIGEHLLPGRLGHFFSLFSFLSSLMATFAYFKSTSSDAQAGKLKWKRLARIAFASEVFSVIAIFSLLFYIISNHLFEYKYAWQHSSLSLEAKYLLACFWEGQEGSFLLWSIWNCLMGLILIRKAKTWEAPVMTVVSLAQSCLAAMIVGVSIFGSKIGSNPFVLLRNEMDAPIFSRPDYLALIKDGNGLNPLLQNYWMVIHPPVLFLGFASSIIPFAYAIAGLWTKKYKEWIVPALPWSLFCAAILGTGIMMGAMWAYESLTFGGFWAWDPVENAALVPWLILVAGIHTLLVFKHTSRSLRSAFFFLLLSYLFVLYSTFLTRSGILGDSSVHAFTDLGMNTQLLLFLLIFLIPVLILFFTRFKYIPHLEKEEQTSSREFWMFIGSLILFASALSIIVMTSLPVFNKIAGLFRASDQTIFKPLAIGEDSEYSYNRIQIYVAISLGLLSATVQYLKYKQTSSGSLFRKVGRPGVIALFLSIGVLLFGNINYDVHGSGYLILIIIAIASCIYAVVANLSYIWIALKGNLKLAGGSIAHFGFGLMLLGILISSSKKQTLSLHATALTYTVNVNEKPGENLTLLKGTRTSMGDYWVTYEGDSAHPKKTLWYYKIRFESKNGKEDYTLRPNAFVNYKGSEGLMSNPAAKHYWNHDLFIYVTSVPDPVAKKDTTQFQETIMKEGDTVSYSGGFFVLEKIISKTNITTAGLAANDTASIATIKLFSKNNSAYTSQPILVKRDQQLFSLPDTVKEANLIFQLNKTGDGNFEIGIKQPESMIQFVTLKVYRFPFINLLWAGTLIMVGGFSISLKNRINKSATDRAIACNEQTKVKQLNTFQKVNKSSDSTIVTDN